MHNLRDYERFYYEIMMEKNIFDRFYVRFWMDNFPSRYEEINEM